MRLTLRRFSSSDHSTLGVLDVDGHFACFVLEDPHRDVKVPGDTRIPAGLYLLELQTVGRLHEKYAAKFPSMHRGMLTLQDVPDFTGVMLHPGNSADDTDGCLLVGDVVVQNLTRPGSVYDSVAAYERIYPPLAAAIAAGALVGIQVVDEG